MIGKLNMYTTGQNMEYSENKAETFVFDISIG